MIFAPPWARSAYRHVVMNIIALGTPTRIKGSPISLLGMAVYVGTVLLGLAILLTLYLTVVFVFARQRPGAFLGAVREVMLLAFSTSTSSSAAVMPLSIKTVEEKLGVRPAVSQFVIPLGATINMNGTALYQGVATIFLAQVFGVDIGLGGMLLIVVTAVSASIGSPATPGVGYCHSGDGVGDSRNTSCRYCINHGCRSYT